MARAAGMINQAPAQGGVRYSAPPAANPYQPSFNSQQAPQQQSMSPLIQQQMMRQQQPMFNPMMQQSSGLQAAMMQMMGRQNQPMMRPQMQGMPQFRAQALGYRPDMAQAQQALNRVQPSVYKTDLDAARARIAELEGLQQPQSYDYSSGG
jgi:hypothetical protein